MGQPKCKFFLYYPNQNIKCLTINIGNREKKLNMATPHLEDTSCKFNDVICNSQKKKKERCNL